MTRSRTTARKAGTAFATLIVRYLASNVSDLIERRALTGAQDRGDISALRHSLGGRIVVECKDYAGQIHVGTWLGEAEAERLNDAAIAGIVIAKRARRGQAEDQIVLMTVRDLVAILTGTRPPEEA